VCVGVCVYIYIYIYIYTLGTQREMRMHHISTAFLAVLYFSTLSHKWHYI